MLKYILKHDERSKIIVAASGFTIEYVPTLMLTEKHNNRLITKPTNEDPDYLLTTYRKLAIKRDAKLFEKHKLVHQIKVHEEVIAGIYRLKDKTSN